MITVEKRTVYQQGRRKRSVFDARCNETCDCRATADDKKAAIAAVEADHQYIAVNPKLERGGCRLSPMGVDSWCLELRVGTRTSSSYQFSAADMDSAMARIRTEYHDHPDCQEFLQ